MSPVVAVCPIHGVFRSRRFELTYVEGAYLGANTERCPHPGCGRSARVMEGTFSFDGGGVATVLSAPDWSRDALDSVQQALFTAGHALYNEATYSSERAYKLLDKKLDDISTQLGARDARIDDLVTEIRSLRRRVPRKRLATILWGTALAAVVALGDFDGAVSGIERIVDFIAPIMDTGHLPTTDELPPELRRPHRDDRV